jgi:patatin-like phospholipase/acyl hydrolase
MIISDLSRDNNAKMVDIALATSAAPTYFLWQRLPYYNEQFVEVEVFGQIAQL